MCRIRVTIVAILLGFCTMAEIAGAAEAEVWAALRAGRHVALMRHTHAPGSAGDPPGFRLDDCATQRNLSAKGRVDAATIGAAAGGLSWIQTQAGLLPPAPKEAAIPPRPDVIPRHWHDPHDLRARAADKGASIIKQSKKGAADGHAKQIGDVKQCRSDGLDPLLRELNLSPRAIHEVRSAIQHDRD